MIRDFVKIRKGTDTLTALKKLLKISKDYILSNSHNHKVDKTIVINFR